MKVYELKIDQFYYLTNPLYGSWNVILETGTILLLVDKRRINDSLSSFKFLNVNNDLDSTKKFFKTWQFIFV